jgi:hypothetical protein
MPWYDDEYLADTRTRTLTPVTPELRDELGRVRSSTRRVVKAVSGEFERLVREGYKVVQRAGEGLFRNPQRGQPSHSIVPTFIVSGGRADTFHKSMERWWPERLFIGNKDRDGLTPLYGATTNWVYHRGSPEQAERLAAKVNEKVDKVDSGVLELVPYFGAWSVKAPGSQYVYSSGADPVDAWVVFLRSQNMDVGAPDGYWRKLIESEAYGDPSTGQPLTWRGKALNPGLPPGDTWYDTTGDVVAGDVVRFKESVFGGSHWSPKYLGEREVVAKVLKDSYGRDRQQHTFTLEVLFSTGTQPLEPGTITRRKGRNVYRHGTERTPWDDEGQRGLAADEKHTRGDRARAVKAERMGGIGGIGGIGGMMNPEYNVLTKDQFAALKDLNRAYPKGDVYLGEIKLARGEALSDALVAVERLNQKTGVHHDVVQYQGKYYSAPEEWVLKVLVDTRMERRAEREREQERSQSKRAGGGGGGGIRGAVRAGWRELMSNPYAGHRISQKPTMSLRTFTNAYIEAALWSSTDDNGEPLDQGNYELSDEARRIMEADAASFYNAYHELWDDDSQAGHDFWLTRNRHGAGFWDGDYPEPQGKQLTNASHKYGEVDLYVGDDGEIYHSPGKPFKVKNPQAKGGWSGEWMVQPGRHGGIYRMGDAYYYAFVFGSPATQVHGELLARGETARRFDWRDSTITEWVDTLVIRVPYGGYRQEFFIDRNKGLPVIDFREAPAERAKPSSQIHNYKGYYLVKANLGFGSRIYIYESLGDAEAVVYSPAMSELDSNHLFWSKTSASAKQRVDDYISETGGGN